MPSCFMVTGGDESTTCALVHSSCASWSQHCLSVQVDMLMAGFLPILCSTPPHANHSEPGSPWATAHWASSTWLGRWARLIGTPSSAESLEHICPQLHKRMHLAFRTFNSTQKCLHGCKLPRSRLVIFFCIFFCLFFFSVLCLVFFGVPFRSNPPPCHSSFTPPPSPLYVAYTC